MNWKRPIYLVPTSLPDGQRDAILKVYSGLANEIFFSLVDLQFANATCGGDIPIRGRARRMAEDSRALIHAFGVRVDGRRRGPFPHQRERKAVAS